MSDFQELPTSMECRIESSVESSVEVSIVEDLH